MRAKAAPYVGRRDPRRADDRESGIVVHPGLGSHPRCGAVPGRTHRHPGSARPPAGGPLGRRRRTRGAGAGVGGKSPSAAGISERGALVVAGRSRGLYVRRTVPEHLPIDLPTAIVLGVVQGITEFLPISSDGHIALAALLFGERDMPLSMVVLLHVGTLIATFIVFRADVAALLASMARGVDAPRAWAATDEGRTILTVGLASIPTAAIGLALHDLVEAWSHVPWIVGACLLGSAIAVGSTRWTGDRAGRLEIALPPAQALLVGVAQGLAVLPGLTRSGSTIACMIALGTAGPAAFRLSFLMSLPAVLGAVVLELRRPVEVLESLGAAALAGAAVSFLVGWASLLLLRRLVDRGRFWAFAIYLVPLGTALIVWDRIG